MSLNLEIAVIIALIIANVTAIFMIKSRFSAIIIISFLVFLLISLNTLILSSDVFFLKISFILLILLVVIQHVVSSFGQEEINYKIKSKWLISLLFIIFLALFCVLIYLARPAFSGSYSKININEVKLNKIIENKDNIAHLKSKKVQKVQKSITNSPIIDNLTLIIMFSVLFPLILLAFENVRTKEIS